MSEDRVIKKLCMSKPEGRRSVGRPKMRWLDDVEEDLRKMRISGELVERERISREGRLGEETNGRKSVLREVKVLQGP
jgi:hypothetical protein